MRSNEPFENFGPWSDSLNFISDIYTLTSVFPEEENQGLVPRLRNGAINLTLNFSKFISDRNGPGLESSIYNANDQLNEFEVLLRISQSLKYITQNDFDIFLGKIEYMKQHVAIMIRKIQREKEKNENDK